MPSETVRRRFSIVVPVFQNEANVPTTVARLLGLRDRLAAYELELVFVDDGSRDRSLALLREQAAAHPGVIKIVKLTRNFGQTPAVQAGLRHASGDCVGIISADLQEPCEMFVEMVAEWERGTQFVMGERQQRREPRRHQFVSGIYWAAIRRFAFEDFPRMGYDFCLLDRQVVEDVNRINEKNSSVFVLIYWLGYKPVRFPITRYARLAGQSQWKLPKKISFTLDTLIGFTYVPARAIVGLSLAAAAASLAYFVYLVFVWLRNSTAPPGWMTLAGVAFLGGSLLLFGLGIIAEYFVRILDESRKRPPFVVERVDGPSRPDRT